MPEDTPNSDAKVDGNVDAKVAGKVADTAPKPKSRAKKAAPKAEAETGPVLFVSRDREPTSFNVCGIKPTRDFSNGRLIWEVPAEKVALFEQNHFVQLCRVVRK